MAFCGLCNGDVKGDWDSHILSKQHRENLANLVLTGSARVQYDLDFKEALERTKWLVIDCRKKKTQVPVSYCIGSQNRNLLPCPYLTSVTFRYGEKVVVDCKWG